VSCHKSKREDFQAFPQSGILVHSSNLFLAELKNRINQSGLLESKTSPFVYCYIIKSVKNINGTLHQKGCGPNWQGGCITLCTCKHFMRTFHNSVDWQGVWIAGFTSINHGIGEGSGRKNALVSLMEVKKGYDSHYDLWDELSGKTKEAKVADKHIFGDVFRPSNNFIDGDQYKPSAYCNPCDSHAHKETTAWHKDIKYVGHNRYASLLVGDEKKSFLWNKPFITAKCSLSRGQKKIFLKEFFDFIQSAI